MSRKQKSPIIVPEKIFLLSVNVFKSKVETEEAFLDAPQEVNGFEFSLAHNFAQDIREKYFRLRLYIILDGQDTRGEALGIKAEYGIEFHFFVENIEEYLIKKEGTIGFHPVLGANLLGVRYSTARGIVLERTQGTFFKGVILPVVDVYKEIAKDE